MLSRRLLTSFATLLSCALPSVAQLPKRLERCLPNPTLAQEIRDMQQEVEPKPQEITLHVARVDFDPKSSIPLELQREISATLMRETIEEYAHADYLKEIGDEMAEVRVRGMLQNKGYFRALPDVKLTVLKTDGSSSQVAVAVSADLGPQYWVGQIQFVATDSDRLFLQPETVLRDLISIKPGDLLNVDVLREGLRKLTRSYEREGYIDMTAEPEFNIEDTKHVHVVHVLVRIDQEKQYHMGRSRFGDWVPWRESNCRERCPNQGKFLIRPESRRHSKGTRKFCQRTRHLMKTSVFAVTRRKGAFRCCSISDRARERQNSSRTL